MTSESASVHSEFNGTVKGAVFGNNNTVNLTFADGTTKSAPHLVPPLPLQGVFGREKAMQDISALLSVADKDQIDVPPVALRGMGGVGKTTLARALGRDESNVKYFPDGVLYVELGPNPVIRLLQNRWGQALDVDLLPERDEDSCQERLRNVLFNRKALVIIDDVWDIKHGSSFDVGGPHCRTIFTTREVPIAHALALRDRTIRVDVLSPEASLQLLNRLAPEVVRADLSAAKRLCEKLEYLPLALKLAGAFLANETDVPSRMRRLLDELIEQRELRLRALKQDEARIGLTEEASLQAILGMSVNRLSPVDKERFAMLAVFGGEPLTWTLDAARTVWECSIEDAEATVAHFIHRGLVEWQLDRYWTHALLFDYASLLMDEIGL